MGSFFKNIYYFNIFLKHIFKKQNNNSKCCLDPEKSNHKSGRGNQLTG
jgi:hypothetical protein